MTQTLTAPATRSGTQVLYHGPIDPATRAAEYDRLLTRAATGAPRQASSNAKDDAWDRAVVKFRKLNGRELAVGDRVDRRLLKNGNETAPDNMACITGRRQVPKALADRHLFPMPEGHHFVMIPLSVAFFGLHSADHELHIAMARPDMVSRIDQDCERAQADTLFASGAMNVLTGTQARFVNYSTGRSQNLSSKGHTFEFVIGGVTLTSEGTKTEIDELRYCEEEDIALVLEFKRSPGQLPNHLPRRQPGYATLAARHLTSPAGQILTALVVATDPLFTEVAGVQAYSDTLHYYIHWFDITTDNLDDAHLISVDKVTIDLYDQAAPTRPTHYLSPTERLAAARITASLER
jgi:hypothetical protein